MNDLQARLAEVRAKAPLVRHTPPPQETAERRSEGRQQIGVMVAEAAAGLTWHDQSLDVLRQVCEQQQWVHVDDVRPLLPATDNGRALGAVFNDAAHRRWIQRATPTGDFPPGAYVCLPSTASNGSGKTLWRSLLHKGA